MAFLALLELQALCLLVVGVAGILGFTLLDWWMLLLGAAFALGWVVRGIGWAPYRIGIIFLCWFSNLLCLLSEWCEKAGDYLEHRKDPNFFDVPPDDEWAHYYEYHDWLIGAGIPVPPVLQRKVAYIRQQMHQ